MLPDQQIVYIVPLTVPQEKKTAPQETTMFGTDQQQTMSARAAEPGKEA